MRIVCPGCEAAYEVPEAMLSPGRTVRCARCGRGWIPLPEQGRAVSPEEDPLAEPPAGQLPTEAGDPDTAVVAGPAEARPEGCGPLEEPAGDGSIHAAEAPAPDLPAMALEADHATTPKEPLSHPVEREHGFPPAETRERPPREGIVVPPRAAPPVARPERGPSLTLAWTLSVLLLLAVVAALLVWRGEVAAAWPPSQWLYRALGLA